MKVVTSFNASTGKFNSLENCRNAVFLAGPCPREDFNDDWRFDAFSILEEIGFDGVVLSPTNPYFKDMASKYGMSSEEAREKQVAWERAAMHVASAIIFWVPRSKKFPALTTNYEFGEWYKKPHVFVGWPEDAEHCDYMRCKLKEQGKIHFSALNDVLQAAVVALNENTGLWFTSDTHFCQQRTLELSRRPFVDVKSMDYEMVSNWNKHITMQDVVVHAGDFIDPDKAPMMLGQMLSILNFKTLHWVLGNYDRKIKDLIIEVAASCKRDVVIHDGCYAFKTDEHSYVVAHEPNDFVIDAGSNDIVLFGHIHGRSFAKRNGFDLGIDYHHYCPISIEQVEWFANAMKYWDENVMSDQCNVKSPIV